MLDVLIKAPGWREVAVEALAAQAVMHTLAYLDLPFEDTEISLLACDDARIAVLNADFRGKQSATNVLSWPATELSCEHEGQPPHRPEPDVEGFYELGDIAIAYETCAREAVELGRTLEAHFTHLIVHGTLHLLGYDHVRDCDATLMQALEIEILGKMGLDDPYRV
ncbi:Endoribonuclease YbeY [Roseobacter fucihabitans]|uniref:Endoribonuclease YbeY n=1 Tax=Roseobacter fucihabitans TaxID=1537242 RepID=A0ABZ2BXL1_9RHOB|nr:rRNA maturation RNase YbeY [Roseobacter litoralis]MBC6965010.1 Endoribonuclease YbeY [Roseobacter litoralis]